MTLTSPNFSLSSLMQLLRRTTVAPQPATAARVSANNRGRAECTVLRKIIEQHPETFYTEYGMVELIVRSRCEG